MSSEERDIDRELDDTAGEEAATTDVGDTAAAADESAAEESPTTSTVTESTGSKSTGSKSAGAKGTGGKGTATSGSGVEAKARARAAREKDGGREFTVSARTVTRIVGGIVAIAVIAALGFGGWKLYDTNKRVDAFGDSKAAAEHFVTEYFAVAMGGNPTPEALRDKVGPLVTDSLRTRLDADAPKTVQWVQESKLANVQTKINASMVESVDRSRAVTVLAVEFTGTSATAPSGGTFVSLLQLTMENVDGSWLVADMGMVPGMGAGTNQGEQPGVPGQTPQAPQSPEATQPAG